MAMNVTIRPLADHDDLASLTDLIHAAFRKLASNGMKYWATYQTVEDTAKRCRSGHCLVAEVKGAVVGTLLVRPPQPDSKVVFYRDPTTWTLGQFAVLPEMQVLGIGGKLHNRALEYAFSNQGQTMALDTANSATELIAMYLRWGYKTIGSCDWRPMTNYLSTILLRPIVGCKANSETK